MPVGEFFREQTKELMERDDGGIELEINPNEIIWKNGEPYMRKDGELVPIEIK